MLLEQDVEDPHRVTVEVPIERAQELPADRSGKANDLVQLRRRDRAAALLDDVLDGEQKVVHPAHVCAAAKLLVAGLRGGPELSVNFVDRVTQHLIASFTNR